jgi:hypothetical protein
VVTAPRFATPMALAFRVALLEPGSAGRIVWHLEYRAERPASAPTQEALVAAWDEFLRDTLGRLEADLRGALPAVHEVIVETRPTHPPTSPSSRRK